MQKNKILNEIMQPQKALKYFINFAVLASEIRVFLVVTALSGSYITGLFATLGTGAWFFLWWDVLDTHPLANTGQKIIDMFFTIWALIMGAIFVFADLAVRVAIANIRIELADLFMLLAISTAANILGGIAWAALDDETRKNNRLRKQTEESQREVRQMKVEEERLAAATQAANAYRELVRKHGADAVRAMKVVKPQLAEAVIANARNEKQPSSANANASKFQQLTNANGDQRQRPANANANGRPTPTPQYHPNANANGDGYSKFPKANAPQKGGQDMSVG